MKSTQPSRSIAPATQRHVLLLHRHVSVGAAAAWLRRVAGLRISVGDVAGHAAVEPAPGTGVLLPLLGVVLVDSDPDQTRALARARGDTLASLAPERAIRGLSRTARSVSARPARPRAWVDDSEVAWGIRAIRAAGSRWSGRGVRLAILDSGLDTGHTDFRDRPVLWRSFVPGTGIEDTLGHGTYCAGVACGPQRPAAAPRYGVAHAAELFVAKVLDGQAQGSDGAVLAALEWAVANGCAVVSLSAGTPADSQDPPSALYEQAAARALGAGTLVIAAAGNGSLRPDLLAPVEHPANCPSIVAVGAISPSRAIAPFSAAGLGAGGAGIDLVAPGVGVYSAWSGPQRYQTASGTSMAVPFVAGIAALFAEACPRERGVALRARLLAGACRLPIPERDAGAGLVRAPE
jgi:subtilisin family serine protease